MTKLLASVLVLLFSLSAFSSGSNAKRTTLSVMTYNLENLFDTKHDKGKKDWTYLPLKVKNSSAEVQAYCNGLSNEYYKKSCLGLDWSNSVLRKKIKNMAKVILSYNKGKGADIVVFQEVENLNVLKMLVSKGLRNKGYSYITLFDGPDSRGIDVGMISKYPVKSQKYHTINLAPHSTRSTRGILEVNYKVGHKSVTVFGNHWPSQANPDEARVIASNVLKDATANSKSDLVIATGDFNTSSDDALNGITLNVLPIYEDVEVQGRRMSNVVADGTHWWRGNWESLDKIFVAKKSLTKKGISVNYSAFDIVYLPFMVKDLEWQDRDTGNTNISENIPARFDPLTGSGFSDHLPVAVEFKL